MKDFDTFRAGFLAALAAAGVPYDEMSLAETDDVDKAVQIAWKEYCGVTE